MESFCFLDTPSTSSLGGGVLQEGLLEAHPVAVGIVIVLLCVVVLLYLVRRWRR